MRKTICQSGKQFSRQAPDVAQNQILVNKALEILAVTRRPLSILELGWFVALAVADGTVRSVDRLSQLVDAPRVIFLIQPFVAHVDFTNLRKRQVKLIHQPPKEFTVGLPTLNPPSCCPASQSRRISTSAASLPETVKIQSREFLGFLEAHIAAICIRYLLLQEIDQNTLFSDESVVLQELPQDPDPFSDGYEPDDSNLDMHCSWEAWEQDMTHYDPAERGFGELFAYASCHWMEHFSAVHVSTEALSLRLADIELLCHARSARLHNWIAQNSRPDCAMQARFIFDSTLYDPLSITCLYGSESMLLHMLEHSDLDGDAFLPDSVLRAAEQILQWGELTRLNLLWESRHGHQLRNLQFFRLVLDGWSRFSYDKKREGWNVVFSLLDDVELCEAMKDEQWGSKLLSKAVSVGCVPVIRRLFAAAHC